MRFAGAVPFAAFSVYPPGAAHITVRLYRWLQPDKTQEPAEGEALGGLLDTCTSDSGVVT